MAPLYKRYDPTKAASSPAANDKQTEVLAKPALYKRYVPTKVSSPAPVKQVAQPGSAIVVSNGGERQGRKRQRTEEEVAQRKAKKLKSKGLDVNVEARPTPLIATEPEPALQPVEEPHPLPQGEFSHVKNAKKRHKLEKEARKARKAAGVKLDHEGVGTPAPSGSTSVSELVEGTSRSDGAQDASLDPQANVAKNTEASPRHQDDSVPEQPNETTSAVPITHDEYDLTLSQPKKRRHKLEHLLNAEGDEEDGEHLQKHKGIIGKFQKSTKLGRIIQARAPEPTPESFEAPKVQDLVIPKAEEIVSENVDATSALPSWLAKPTIVSSRASVSFTSLHLEAQTVSHLEKLGFTDALPVQRALIPILLAPGVPGAKYLPGTDAVVPDVAVSAATGSGKTIAYLLPVIEALRRSRDSGKLKALVVAPTRELVVQIAAVADSLAKGTSVRVGMATGAGNFKEEATKMIKKDRRYDPDGYEALMAMANRRNYPLATDLSETETNPESALAEAEEIADAVNGLVDHVPIYSSAIDLLVATPGRLLEHLSKSHGFSILNLEWLVLDEADKLLDQQSDELLRVLNEHTSTQKPLEQRVAQTRSMASRNGEHAGQQQRLRKVLLSATMTRDISKLVELRLRRPQLVVVRGDEQRGNDWASNGAVETDGDVAKSMELPSMLDEHSVHVGDGSEKPLYLAELLRKKILASVSGPDGAQALPDVDDDDSSSSEDSDSETDSDSSSDADTGDEQARVSESSTSSESSDSESDGDEDEDEELDLADQSAEVQSAVHPQRAAMLAKLTGSNSSTAPTILIFTSSTESANRLSYLLKALQPHLDPHIATMTRANSKGKNSHPKSKSIDPIITISTDRAGRGLDTIGKRAITHVVQYDVPRSATSYVHRVGRTARAGRGGSAWTLFTHSEARWFVNEVVRSKKIKRLGNVERVKLEPRDEDLREMLEQTVASMRTAVLKSRKA